MPAPHTQKLLKSSSLVVKVGNGVKSLAVTLGVGVIVFSATGIGPVQAQSTPAPMMNIPSQEAESQPQGVLAEVLDVRRLRASEQNRGNRVRTNAATIGGAIIGGLLGHQVGGGRGQDLATIIGAGVGGTMGGRAGARRNADDMRVPGYDNMRQVQNDALVTVAVNVGNDYTTYQIQQSAAIPVRRGDFVLLTTSEDGTQMRALPVEIERTRRPRR